MAEPEAAGGFMEPNEKFSAGGGTGVVAPPKFHVGAAVAGCDPSSGGAVLPRA